MSDPAAQKSISIDVLKDLDSRSALTALLEEKVSTEFPMLGTLVPYATQPILEAAKAKATATFSPSKSASWKVDEIMFSLEPEAKCTITIAEASESFPVAMSIEDSSQTESVSASAPTGSVYVNLDLDFSIQGNVSASGNAGPVAISAKAADSQSATLSFCLPVDGKVLTADAIKTVFEEFVFPLDPDCLKGLHPGTLLKVTYSTCLSCSVSAQYGLGDYKLAGPDLNSVKEPVAKVAGLTPPSIEANVGVKGSVSYEHTGAFTLIINKLEERAARVYLTRAAANDMEATVGMSAAITTCAPDCTVDATQLGTFVKSVTGNQGIASEIQNAASGGANDLTNGLNAKMKKWAQDVSGTDGLTAGLSRQTNRVALFVYDVDTAQATVAGGWSRLVSGSIDEALHETGFKVDAGSGVSDSLTRASKLQFQLFNLFAYSDTNEFFSKGYTEIGKDGSIHILRDIGKESDSDTKKALKKFRIYFEATATETDSATPQIHDAGVDLCFELSEQSNWKYAASIASVMEYMPESAERTAATSALSKFIDEKAAGTLDLKITLKQSAYGRLSSSPFVSGKPPANQYQDTLNWTEFTAAAEALKTAPAFLEPPTYELWKTFNVACCDQPGSAEPANRHETGDPSGSVNEIVSPYGQADLIKYFLGASQQFMNLCDNLRSLAAGLPDVKDSKEWDETLEAVKNLVDDSDFEGYRMPTLAALLKLCAGARATCSIAVTTSKDGKSLTCLATLA